jgi:peroxiredoxin
MKRIVLLFAAAALVLTAGAQTKKVGKAVPKTEKASYSVTGTAEGIADGTKLYLGIPSRSGFEKGDSSIVKGGKFAMKFVISKGAVRGASIAKMDGEKYKYLASLYLENSNITVNIPKNGDAVVKGGKENRIMKEMQVLSNKNIEELKPLYYIANDTTKALDVRLKAKEDFEKAQAKQYKDIANLIKVNIPSGASDLLVGYYSSAFDEESMNGIFNEMKAKCPTDPVYLQLKKDRELSAKTAVGKHFTDIALKSPEGQIVKVSDFVGKNKLVLIDFWASWCGPCRGEMPNVIKAYNEFKDKGFAVVGVSLDNNAAAWKKAIKDLGIPWAQMSDLKGWQCAGAALYNVRAIPATVLIDQSGTIIARDLRGEELIAKLKELLK